MRTIESHAASGDARAAEAIELFCYRVKKYIGAYIAALGGIDALIFTGGIGEHSDTVRAGCCEGLEGFGIALDTSANGVHSFAIHAGTVPSLVIPADEECAIAQAVSRIVSSAPGSDYAESSR